ncbi:methyltransferase family protein [Catellatospora tritici]|uniref:methyltransferase family protein n=1 Tax=Catellatospora tritici TaxID=2851566 RepID=UPI001C2DE4F0|nr:isoprenylcysteine carboxylmethyltransferase family protein [Catellatospora tritici]MBV1856347.1 isoprenylcysteine carboxylmethyltransferase family protein [Catellatospora tritici]
MAIYCWCALEVVLVVRDLARGQGRRRRDRGTRVLVQLALGGAFLLGWLMRNWVPGLDTPARDVFAAAGAVVIWAGLAVRSWAVVTLGRSFRTFIEVDADQVVVTDGPYRWVRHPSYTGLLLVTVGFGLGVGNWLSLAVCVVVPLAGLLPRIAVEESEMTRVLGEQYRSYQRVSYRLVPGLW